MDLGVDVAGDCDEVFVLLFWPSWFWRYVWTETEAGRTASEGQCWRIWERRVWRERGLRVCRVAIVKFG